jgi:hypothetical protein
VLRSTGDDNGENVVESIQSIFDEFKNDIRYSIYNERIMNNFVSFKMNIDLKVYSKIKINVKYIKEHEWYAIRNDLSVLKTF